MEEKSYVEKIWNYNNLMGSDDVNIFLWKEIFKLEANWMETWRNLIH